MEDDIPWLKHLDDIVGTPVLAILAAARVGDLVEVLSAHVEVPLLQANTQGHLDVAGDSITSLPSGRGSGPSLVNDMVGRLDRRGGSHHSQSGQGDERVTTHLFDQDPSCKQRVSMGECQDIET